MRRSAELHIEILRPANPLAPPRRGDFVSPTLLDGLLSMLVEREDCTEAPPVANTGALDLGFEPEDLESAPDGSADVPEHDQPAEATGTEDEARPRRRSPRNMQERIRALSSAEQQKLARSGEQTERVALERIYGKAVWENLLRNPKITQTEVARIARMGVISQPLIETIVSNRGWLSSPQVRRALLSNRRLKSEMILSVLRATPKNELRLVPKQTAYSTAVREAAQKLIK